MAALFQCFGKRKSYSGASQSKDSKVKDDNLDHCRRCKKASKLVNCSNCNATLIGYWEEESNALGVKNSVTIKDGNPLCKMLVCRQGEEEVNSETVTVDSDSNNGHSSNESVPRNTNNGHSSRNNGNGINNFDYRPSEQGNIPGMSYMVVSKNDPKYNMNHPRRGKALIFDFSLFEDTGLIGLDSVPPKRPGSHKDTNDLTECLEKLAFEVIVHDNLKRRKFDQVLRDIRREDHSDADCILIAIMTHGMKNSIYLSDGTTVPVNTIWQEFEADKCPTLAGKPKIFLIQACRGDEYDHGTKVLFGGGLTPSRYDTTDSGTFSYVIPNAADIIVAFSCPLGHYSWRDPEKGTWFIQSICRIFNENAFTMELQHLLTNVARNVALNYESNTDQIESHKKKQVPSTSSTLIRDVYFNQKPLVRFTPRVPPVGNCATIATQTAEAEVVANNGISNISLQQVQTAIAVAQSQNSHEMTHFGRGENINNGVVPISSEPVSILTARVQETAIDNVANDTRDSADDKTGEPSATENVRDDDLQQQTTEDLNELQREGDPS